jgi:hypothetical protein
MTWSPSGAEPSSACVGTCTSSIRRWRCRSGRSTAASGSTASAGALPVLERKQGEGKSRWEALRCLKRQLARTVYTTLKSEPSLT